MLLHSMLFLFVLQKTITDSAINLFPIYFQNIPFSLLLLFISSTLPSLKQTHFHSSHQVNLNPLSSLQFLDQNADGRSLEPQSLAFKEEEEEESMKDTVPFLQMLQSEEDPLPFTSFKELLSLQNLHNHWELESYLSHNETNRFYHNPVSALSLEAATNHAFSSQQLPLSRQDMTVPSSSSTPNSRRKRNTISNPPLPEVTRGKRKRRKTKPSKDIEEIENQRINHIAVERNRRRQMNEHISSLRSLLPPSYIQRGDQASIVEGAINYAKVLEQVIQSLELQKRTQQSNRVENRVTCVPRIEATLIQNHVNLKVECRKKQGQLLKGIISLEKLRLTVLHLNISSFSCSSVSYCFNLKMEDDCKLESSEEITKVAQQIFHT